MLDIKQELADYGNSLSRLDLAVRSAIWSSIQAANKAAGERRYWSSVLFVRLATVSKSILTLCPKPVKTGVEGNWDFASIASLTRNLFEGAAFFLYFTQPTEGEEWRARLNLMQLNDATHRARMFDQAENHEEAKYGQSAIDDLKERLSNNLYFQTLAPKLQTQLLQGYRPSIYTLRENAALLTNDTRIWGFFEFLSSHTHTLPLSFYRIREQNRTGVESDTERRYIRLAMDFASDILTDITTQFKDNFQDIASFDELPADLDFPTLMTSMNVPTHPNLNRAQRRATKKQHRRRN